MDFKSFLQTNHGDLEKYSNLSKLAGGRVDFVQGGGGNTSVKLKDGVMAIKASGFKLSQVEIDEGYALLNYEKIRAFFADNDIDSLKDIEGEGSQAVKSSAVNLEGFQALRPSVEAGFHALQAKYVLHTHSVYANLATCAVEGREIAEKAMAGSDYTWGFVDYTNPGTKLTYSIKTEIDRVEKETGKKPSVIFMQNHGIIATHDDDAECIRIHQDANDRIAKYFGVTAQEIQIFSDTLLHDNGDGTFQNKQSYLKNKIKGSDFGIDFFVKDALYPDQLVFLAGNVEISDSKTPDFTAATHACTIYPATGDVYYKANQLEAQTIQDTLCSIIFISQKIEEKNYKISRMDDSGKDFIANWESEKYRKTLVKK